MEGMFNRSRDNVMTVGSSNNLQGLFLIFGAVTFCWSLATIWLIPDSPLQAKFLKQEQRAQAVGRIRDNRTSIKSYEWKWAQVYEALIDPKTWFIFFYRSVNTCSD